MRNIPLNKQAKKKSETQFGDPTSDSKKRTKQSDSYRGKVDISSFIEDIMKDLKADPTVNKYRLKKKSSEMMAKRSFIEGLINDMPNQDDETKAVMRKVISSLNEVKNLDTFLDTLVQHGVRVTIDADEEGKKGRITYNFDKNKKDKSKKTKKKFKDEEEEELDKKACDDNVLEFYNLDENDKLLGGKKSKSDSKNETDEDRKCGDCGENETECECKEGKKGKDDDSEGKKIVKPSIEEEESEAGKKGEDDEDEDDDEGLMSFVKDDDEDKDESFHFTSKNKKMTTILNHKIDHNLITNEAQYSSEYIKLTNMSENQIEQEASRYKIDLTEEPKSVNRLDGIIKEANQKQMMLNKPIVISQKESGNKFSLDRIQWTDAVVEASKVPDTFEKGR